MPTPLPNRAVRGSRSGKPIMALLDLLGRRWMLRVIWELREEALTFRELRQRCDAMSPTMLNQRLHELREAALVLHSETDGYVLAPLGKDLIASMQPLMQWSAQWQQELENGAA
ncbi:MAG TPA: helix-turn-helix domain-containing protein [Burkholderiaceae bacterium]